MPARCFSRQAESDHSVDPGEAIQPTPCERSAPPQSKFSPNPVSWRCSLTCVSWPTLPEGQNRLVVLTCHCPRSYDDHPLLHLRVCHHGGWHQITGHRVAGFARPRVSAGRPLRQACPSNAQLPGSPGNELAPTLEGPLETWEVHLREFQCCLRCPPRLCRARSAQ